MGLVRESVDGALTKQRRIASYKRWIKWSKKEIAERERLILNYEKIIKELEKT